MCSQGVLESPSNDFGWVFPGKSDPEQLEFDLTTVALVEEKAPTLMALCHFPLTLPSHFHIWDTPRYSKSYLEVRFGAYFQTVKVYVGPELSIL